ncbi:MAG: 7-carboxy-7-deazaguanine synthase QueE [Proteobacteria bacterium]|nr:7-carboxy-7-deazaguanine synthase QueE [Pseudomonadota bacterium]
MFGKNKILKAEVHEGLSLDIQEIFPTLQGEGPYAGWPAVFIRLGGCNLACEFCDTEFETYQNLSLEKIITEVLCLAKNSEEKIIRKLIVITGGEPMRQPITKLCEELVKLDFLLQIETNGLIFRELPKQVKIICSPKVTNNIYHQIRPDLLSRVSAFKFIISKTNKNYSTITEVGQSKLHIPVYVQPMDEYDEVKNKANLKYAAQLCDQYGYFLSMQMHKILGIR